MRWFFHSLKIKESAIQKDFTWNQFCEFWVTELAICQIFILSFHFSNQPTKLISRKIKLAEIFTNLHTLSTPLFSDSLVDDELEIVVKPSCNPFCSSLPARIPTGFAFRNFKRRSVVMSNDFICVVRAQSAWNTVWKNETFTLTGTSKYFVK